MRMVRAAVFLFLVPFLVLGQQPKEPEAKEIRGWKFAVVGVERQSSWTIPIVGRQIYPTGAGAEFFIVHLRADPIAPRTTKEGMSWGAEDVKQVSVATANGTTYARETGERIHGADYHLYSEFFSVPRGAPVTSLSFLGVTFDLSNVKRRSRSEAIEAQAVVGPTGEAQRTKETVIKDYTPNATYALGDVVTLKEGDRLSVEVVPSTDATTTGTAVDVKVKVTGEARQAGFTWGQEDSAIALVAGGKRIAVSKAWTTNEVVAVFSKETLVVRNLTLQAKNGKYTATTTEHPLLFRFVIPLELAKAPKQLELKEVMIGEGHYSLIVRLDQ